MDDSPQSGIYQIRHTGNGKVYVGSAVNIAKRFGMHQRMLRRGAHHSIKLQRAWDKYGASAFSFSVLETVEDKARLLEREQFWLDQLNSASHGYNITPTAGSLLGFKHTPETRRKMSKAKIGAERSEEHCLKLSAALSGRKMSAESRQKMRDAKLGKTRKPHSPETRAKMSAAALGRTFSDLTLARMSAAAKARERPA